MGVILHAACTRLTVQDVHQQGGEPHPTNSSKRARVLSQRYAQSPCRTSQLHAMCFRTCDPAPRIHFAPHIHSPCIIILACLPRQPKGNVKRIHPIHASTVHPTQTPTPHLPNNQCSSNSRSRRIRSSSWSTCRWTRRRRSSPRGGARSRLRCCWPWGVLDWI